MLIACAGTEWGNPNEEKWFEYMHSYAPYNNIKAGVKYPALLLTTGLHDPRVGYWEGAKFTAKVRECYRQNVAEDHSAGENLIMLKTDMSTGHFSASDRYKYLKEASAEYAFILSHICPTKAE